MEGRESSEKVILELILRGRFAQIEEKVNGAINSINKAHKVVVSRLNISEKTCWTGAKDVW